MAAVPGRMSESSSSRDLALTLSSGCRAGAEIEEIEAAVPLNEIVGDRYNAGGLNTIDR